MQVIGEPSQAVTDGGVELHLGQKETITQNFLSISVIFRFNQKLIKKLHRNPPNFLYVIDKNMLQWEKRLLFCARSI